MTMDNTTERTRAFLRYFHSEFGWFESITGIKASKWRDLERGKTKAVTAEMIDELCRYWPEFAYWLVTGNERSERGQCVPTGYFDLSYGEVRALEPSGYSVTRNAAGELNPELGNIGITDRKSKEYELSVASRILYFSATMNESDAEAYAPAFWEGFIKQIKNGEEIFLGPKQLKVWANKFEAHNGGH